MKTVLSFLLATILVTGSFAQNTEQKISEKVKVVFPGKPEEQKAVNGAMVYTYVKDSSAAYMALNVDLSPLGVTAEVIASAGDALWDQMKAPMMAQLPGADLSKSEMVSFKGKRAMYMEIDGSKSELPILKGKKVFSYSFFTGSILNQVSYYSASPTAKAEDAKAYFDSVVIAD